MLGGDKAFSDRLSWALAVPLAVLAFFATGVAASAVGLVFWSDLPPRWFNELTLAAAVFVGARVGAATAPARKFSAAVFVAIVLCAFGWRTHRSVMLPLGGALACVVAWGLPDDDAKKTPEKEG